MKKIIYLLSSLMLVFTACDPMEDVYDELDQLNPDVYKKNMSIELANKDYELLKGKTGVPSTVTSGHYFSSEEQAAALIPAILDKKYPQLGDGTSAAVDYNKLVYAFNSNKVAQNVSYTVTSEDYTAVGMRYGNFDSADDMIRFLEYKYPTPVETQLVVLTYDYYTGTTNTVTDSFYYLNGQWINVYHVTAANYDQVDRGRYDNFTSADDKLLPSFFNRFLSDNVFGANAGDIHYVSYLYYSGSAKQRIYTMMFDGVQWKAVTDNVIATSSLSFVKKDGIWKPDLTIRYTLVAADYQWIAANPALGTDAARSNLGSFGNFYQSNPNSSNYWSQAMINKAMGALLKYKYPNSEVGQKYQLTYAAYNGGNIVATVTMELQASGEYVAI